ncbi:DUF892 family protein [Bradyrhizobium ganzhouense]|uniref:DUF892 family protein n=1 Tax=Bradyrhizobium ganzhouense TaxID=1179767 RepID=UPI003CF681CD
MFQRKRCGLSLERRRGAEQQPTKALPKMADPQLKQGFLTHLEETKQQVTRLEEVFEMLAKTLEEEKATDKKLTTLAESKVNLRAAS